MGWEIIGHEWAIAFLQRSIVRDRAAHAYLLSGPSRIGKTLFALRVAQALNCEVGGGEPCLHCRSCKRIARGNHPDVRLSGMATQAQGMKSDDAARQKELKIDTVREWQSDIHLRPYEGRRRVLILHDAERLTDAAANAMLKTLEEPPPAVTLILVAHTTGDLMSTIVSRCQTLKLRPVPRAQIADALHERANCAAADAAVLAAWSAGRVGWALQMLDMPEVFAACRAQLDTLVSLVSQPRSVRFHWAEERAKEYRGGDQGSVFDALDLWQRWWRDVLLTMAGCPEYVSYIDRHIELAQAASMYAMSEVYAFITRLTMTVQQLRENVNPQLALENIMLHLPGAIRKAGGTGE